MTEKSAADISVKDRIIKNVLPYAFAVTIVAAIINVYVQEAVSVYTLLAAVLSAAVFAVCDFINRHRKLGVPVYIVMMGVVLVSTNMFLNKSEDRFGFVEWFLSAGEFSDDMVLYLLPTIIGFSFFIASIVYYFSHIIYRISIMTLLSIIPCALFVKTAQNVPVGYMALLAALNVFIYIEQNRSLLTKGKIVAGKGAAAAAYVDFAVAAVLIAVFLPKPQETPFYEKFEEFSSRFTLRGSYGQMSGGYTKHSGNADEYLSMESGLLYYVNTYQPQHFKVQVFDSYNSENRYWEYNPELTAGYYDWQQSSDKLKLSTLYDIYKAVGGEFADSIPDGMEFDDNKYFARIRAVDYPSSYAIAPIRITSLSFFDNPDIKGCRTKAGEIFPSNNRLAANDGYDIYYYDQNFAKTSGWMDAGLCDISMSKYGEELKSAASKLRKNGGDASLAAAAESFYNEYDEARIYAAGNYSKPSETIQQLSAEITAGLEYDYQKAAALEAFFQSGEFAYDLAYKAPEENDTPEFFILESKRGTCSDFATAYCLLARAAGLTVRYVEGFNSTYSEENQLYMITTENSHAYPEVFIPGAGWLVYEPTVRGSNEQNGNSDGDGNNETDKISMVIIVVAVIISALAVLLLFMLIPKLEKLIFRIRVHCSAPEKAVILIYGRFVSRLSGMWNISCSSMTVEQVEEFVCTKTGESCSPLLDPFSEVCYGGLKTDKKRSALAYDCAEMQLRMLKKYKKEQKKQKKFGERYGKNP
ncbi:MAG: transglutaminase-like domain-containing protein [Huintestinicola sp.]